MDVEEKMDSEDIKTNPWEVADNLDQFLYFCCPECDEREKSKVKTLKSLVYEYNNATKR